MAYTCGRSRPWGRKPSKLVSSGISICLEWYLEQPDENFNTNTLKCIHGTATGVVEFLDRIQQVVWNRTCFQIAAEEGERTFVGLGPSKAQIGDIFCVLFGCSAPVVLSPRGNDFIFLGACYVHGIMEGEAVDPMPQKSVRRTFDLR